MQRIDDDPPEIEPGSWRPGVRRLAVWVSVGCTVGAMLAIEQPMTSIAMAAIAVAWVFVSRVI